MVRRAGFRYRFQEWADQTSLPRARPVPLHLEWLEDRTLLNNGVPTPDHVVIVVEENHSDGAIIGSPSAPYINSLANDSNGALFTQSYAIEHPSQPNYLDLFAGSNQGVTGDNLPSGLPFTTANLGAELLAQGKSFVGYSEDLPSAGFTGTSSGAYARKHNPWVNWQSATTNGIPAAGNQPLTAFPSDYSTLPTVSFVVPNLNNDMHDGSVATGDAWLQQHLDGYVQWAKTHNSLLIVTWDEDDYLGNNHIPTLFVGSMVKAGQYSEHIDHFTVLRTVEDMYGLSDTGNSAGATPIRDVWAGPSAAAAIPGGGVYRYETAAGWVQLTTSPAAALATDGNGAVVAAFPGQGVQRYQPGVGWKPLTASNASLLAMDANGDVAAEFSGAGVWRYTGAAGWRQLTASNASHLAMNARGDVVAEFPGAGVWRFTNAWKQLLTPPAMDASLVAIDSNDDVVAEFPTHGLWLYTDAASAWAQATAVNASLLAMDAGGDFAAEIPGAGVNLYQAAHSGTTLTGYGAPTLLNASDATQLTMDQADNLIAEFPNAGVFLAAAGSTSFVQIGTANASLLAENAGGDTAVSSDLVAQVAGSGVERFDLASNAWKAFDPVAGATATLLAEDANGDVVAEIPTNDANTGVWLYRDAVGWLHLPKTSAGSSDASQLAINAVGDVVAEFPNHGVWRYTAASAAWTQLTGSNASVLAANANGDVAAEFPGAGVWRFTNAAGWSRLTGSNASLLAMGANGKLVGDFPGFGLYQYSNGGWQFLTGSEASLLVMDGNGGIAANFPGDGLWRYSVAKGWVQLNSANASLLVIQGSSELTAGFVSSSGNALLQYILGETGAPLPTPPANVSVLAADANGPSIVADDLVTVRAGAGIWRYEDAVGFMQLPNPTGVTGDPTLTAIDLAGDVAGSYSTGIYLYRDSTGWQQLTIKTARELGIDGLGDVVAELSDGSGLYRYWSANPGGQYLTAGSSQLAAAYNGAIVAEFPGQGVWRFTTATGWTQLTSADASTLAVNFIGQAVAEFPTTGPAMGVGVGISVYNNAAWKVVTGTTGKQLALDASTNVAVVFTFGSGVTVYPAGSTTPTSLDSSTTMVTMDALGDVVVFIPGTGVRRYRGLSPTYTGAVLDTSTITEIS